MNDIWFTADTHFGHANIIKYCARPYKNVEEMDATIIKRWNEVVKPGDLVYHLGDFSFANQGPYLRQLNGEKVLILGNHDHKQMKSGKGGWKSVHDLLPITMPGEKAQVVLCHYAMRVWPRSHHGALHLYGHSHGNIPDTKQSCDVGVDCWSFRPISLREIKVHLGAMADAA